MAERYEPHFEQALAFRVCELEDELHDVQRQLRDARQALKEYITQHAEERSMVADTKLAAMKR